MQLHFKRQEGTGLFEVLGPHNSIAEELELALLTMNPGDLLTQKTLGKESVLVILAGSCAIEVEGICSWDHLGTRKNVFSGRATTLYLPCDQLYYITAKEDGLEAIIVRAPTKISHKPYVIGPDDISIITRGSENWLREVHTLLDSTHPASKLLVGETFNIPGGWSSYPPHKHDTHNPPHETRLQEVYHFRLQPEHGFGLFSLYSNEHGLDETITVRNGDSVLVPFGYHTVVAAPGYTLYYFWALAGEERDIHWNQDPAHAWIASKK